MYDRTLYSTIVGSSPGGPTNTHPPSLGVFLVLELLNEVQINGLSSIKLIQVY